MDLQRLSTRSGSSRLRVSARGTALRVGRLFSRLGKRLVPPGYRQRRTSCLEWYNGLEKKVCDHFSKGESQRWCQGFLLTLADSCKCCQRFNMAGPVFGRSASLHRPAPVPRLPGGGSHRLLRCGWSRANAWRQTGKVNRRAQAKRLSKPRRLHQLAARHGVNPTPCPWMFGRRWTPALICDAPNLHNLGQIPCSIDA